MMMMIDISFHFVFVSNSTRLKGGDGGPTAPSLEIQPSQSNRAFQASNVCPRRLCPTYLETLCATLRLGVFMRRTCCINETSESWRPFPSFKPSIREGEREREEKARLVN